MWGQIHFDELVKIEPTTISGSLSKLGWDSYITIHITAVFASVKPLITPTNQSFFSPQKTCDIRNIYNFFDNTIFPEWRNVFGQTSLYFKKCKGSEIHYAIPFSSFMQFFIGTCPESILMTAPHPARLRPGFLFLALQTGCFSHGCKCTVKSTDVLLPFRPLAEN
jgi:hypothetical protein